MKTNKKVVRVSNLEKRRGLTARAIPAVRQLVKRFDLASVQAAVKTLYEERKASQELRDAERKVEALKKRLGV